VLTHEIRWIPVALTACVGARLLKITGQCQAHPPQHPSPHGAERLDLDKAEPSNPQLRPDFTSWVCCNACHALGHAPSSRRDRPSSAGLSTWQGCFTVPAPTGRGEHGRLKAVCGCTVPVCWPRALGSHSRCRGSLGPASEGTL
jgi:hypothetical protein